MRKLCVSVVAVVGLMLAMGTSVRADSITFYLTQGECTSNCGAGTAPAPISNSSAVSVTVTTTTGSAGDWTGATVTFTAPSGTIDAPVLINASGAVEASSATESLAPSSPCTVGVTIAGVSSCAAGSEDHFGTMNIETGSAGGKSTITITLTAESTNSWADAAAVLKPTTGYGAAYSQGFEAVEGGNQYAGYYSGTVPEPASVLLFGSVLLISACFFRRKVLG